MKKKRVKTHSSLSAPPSVTQAGRAVPWLNLGKSFIHPAFDYLIIGGGLSLLAALALWLTVGGEALSTYVGQNFVGLILFSNSAHFAASTVRLYTKPGATRQLPFLSFVFPFIAFAGAALGVIFPSTVAAHFYSLYLSWSPYHYAAQAYGLALMYAYRAGVQLTQGQRRFFFVSCLMGFFLAMLSQNDNRAGIWWVVPWVWTRDYPVFGMAVKIIRGVLIGLSLIAPMASFFWIRRSNAKPLPLISLLIPVTNGLWFGIFPFMGAFGLSAVFHGLQYLAIVTIFHVRDQQEREDNRHGWAYHAVWFYLACLLLGYALFQCWPYGFYALLGLDHAMSVFVIVAAINIHHFIVDAYIWKLRKDPNYRIVLQGI